MTNVTLPRILFIGLGLACIRHAVPQTTNPVQPKQPAFVVSLRAERDTVKSGAPIILKKMWTNRTDHNIVYGKDAYHPDCAADVFDEAGDFAPDKKLGYHHGRLDLKALTEALARMSPEQVVKSGLLTGSLVEITLKPGEAWVETCDISSLYDMTKMGAYKIVAPDSAGAVKSNQIEVTVTK